MTEEEINKKAEKHCNEVLCNAHENCNEVIKCRDWRSRRAGFFCGYEQALKDFEKENAELKEQISTKDILIKELQEQKVYWKKSSFDWRHKFFKKGSTKRLVQKDEQLTKAKELLKRWVELSKPKLEGYPIPPIQEQTEQFLKDCEVEK